MAPGTEMKTPQTTEGAAGNSALADQARASHRIRVGVGGWTYAPWRDNFFPKGLPHQEELRYASRRLTAIEVNGTYYRGFKPSAFAMPMCMGRVRIRREKQESWPYSYRRC